jgi:hypothetical protein
VFKNSSKNQIVQNIFAIFVKAANMDEPLLQRGIGP